MNARARRILRGAEPVVLALWLMAALAAWVRVVDKCVWRSHHTIGLSILLPVWILCATARYQLGASFTARPEARTLVTTGLYRRIRHPIYLFAEGIALAVVIFLGRPVLLVVCAVMVHWQVRRARREDDVLEAAFGDDAQRNVSRSVEVERYRQVRVASDHSSCTV